MKKNEIITKMNSDSVRYAEYEELLLRRDRLIRESGSILTAYTAEFGDMINENFELKIKCIRTKKAISYCHRLMNRGLTVNVDRMNDELDKEMKLYYVQLKEMLNHTKDCKDSGTISEMRLSRSKKIYRRLAKLLHPDMNSAVSGNKKLMELWDKIYEAYLASDAEELENLEALAGRLLKSEGGETFIPNTDNLEERIERIENRINEILTSEPYIYSEILEDEEKKAAHRSMLEDEHSEYEEYLKALTAVLTELLGSGGISLTWQMN